MTGVDRAKPVALVTGAGGGIGSAIATELAASGSTVIATDTNEDAAAAVVRTIAAAGGQAVSFMHDVTDPDASARIVAETRLRFGRIDALVNSAGISDRSPLDEMRVEQWRRMIDVNLTGTFLVTRAVVPIMKEQHHGYVVSIASVVGKTGEASMSHYAASKFGVIGFTQSAALELGSYGITVNTVCPGIVRTAMLEPELCEIAKREGSSVEEAWTTLVNATPLGRGQEPADIARVVHFLISGQADNITGQSLNVDGGYVMH